MEFKFDKQDNSYALLTVQVAESDFLPEFNKQIKEQAKKASFKGFRPGKVPASLVKKMIGKDLKMDVFNNSVSKAVDDYLKENKVNTMFQPMMKGDYLTPDKLDAAKEFTLEFELVVPEVSYELSKDTKVGGYKLEVSDQDVDNTIVKLKDNYPNIVDAEVAEAGDTVKATFKAVEGEFEKEATLELDDKVQEEVKSAFVGKKVEEEVTFDIEKVYEDEKRLRLLFGGTKEDSEEFKGQFTAVISGITRKEEAELNQEFFDKVVGEGKVSDEEGFKTELKELISNANGQAIDSMLQQEITKTIMDGVDVSFPVELLKKIYKLNNTSKEGVAPTDEEVEEKYASFEDAVKWRVISDKIAEAAEIKVESEDIVAEAKAQLSVQMAQFGMGDMEDEKLTEFAMNYLNSEDGRYYQQTFDAVYNNKIMGYIKENVTVEEEVVSLEQFEEKLKAEQEAQSAE